MEVACPVSFSASSLGRHCELTSVGTDYQVHALSTLHVSEPMQTDEFNSYKGRFHRFLQSLGMRIAKFVVQMVFDLASAPLAIVE